MIYREKSLSFQSVTLKGNFCDASSSVFMKALPSMICQQPGVKDRKELHMKKILVAKNCPSHSLSHSHSADNNFTFRTLLEHESYIRLWISHSTITFTFALNLTFNLLQISYSTLNFTFNPEFNNRSWISLSAPNFTFNVKSRVECEIYDCKIQGLKVKVKWEIQGGMWNSWFNVTFKVEC